MALVKVPTEQQWLQPNTSVLYGNIFASRNVDFSLPGFLKLAPRTRYVNKTITNQILSIVYGDFGGTAVGVSATNLYYFVTASGITVAESNLTDIGALTNASTPTFNVNATDAVSWNNGLWVTITNNLSNLTGGVWTNTLMSLTSGIPHPLAVSPELESLLVGNGNLVQRRTTAGVNTTVNTLPSFQRIQWIRVFNQSCWVGTRNLNNGQAAVYQWDQSAANFNQEYLVDCPWIYSGFAWNGNLFIMTADGRLMSFNGAGFTEVGRIPAYTDILSTSDFYWQQDTPNSLGSVFQRGTDVIDGLPHVFLNAETVDNGVVQRVNTKQSSGVWVFDPSIGFYHKYSLSNSNLASTVDYGIMALDSGASAISPILNDPTGNASDIVSSAVAGTVLFGGQIKDASNTTAHTILSATTGDNVGSFRTTRIGSPNDVKESWQQIWLKFEEFQSASNKIIVKYRSKYRQNLPFTTTSNITWTSGTTFTSTLSNFASVVAGDEVTIVQGAGSGLSAHISSIAFNTGTYTVVLDETITGVVASNIGKVMVDNFTKLNTIVSIATIDEVEVGARFAKIAIPFDNSSTAQPAPAEWIELKVEMRGDPKTMVLEKFSIKSESQIKEII